MTTQPNDTITMVTVTLDGSSERKLKAGQSVTMVDKEGNYWTITVEPVREAIVWNWLQSKSLNQ